MNVEQVFKQYPDESKVKLKSPIYCADCGACFNAYDKHGTQFTCQTCGEVYYHNPLPAVSVLVVDGDNYLLENAAQRALREINGACRAAISSVTRTF